MQINLSEETIRTVHKVLRSQKILWNHALLSAQSEYAKDDIENEINMVEDALSVFEELMDSLKSTTKTLKEFYDSISPDIQISMYNQDCTLILNENNVCDCDEIVEKYADLRDYAYKINDGYLDIILNVR